MPNALRRKYQSYDDEMRSDWQPKDPTPRWLQNTLNVPYNVLALGSNAMIDGYRGGKRMMTGQSTDPVADTMAALGAAGMASVAAPARAAVLGARTRPAAAFKAYHGSPHDFDRFSMDKIGTGEGAQAYGHGLYFAENSKVADEYRRQLTGNPLQVFESKREAATAGVPVEGLNGKWHAMKNNTYVTTGAKGNLYEVNIKANKDDFLDYDAGIWDQHPDVEDVVRKHINIDDTSRDALRTPIGEHLSEITNRYGYQHKIYDDLKEAGIPGIKYKDAGSRGGEGGTYNYVIFDENLIEIAKKNGIPVKQTERGTEISERGMQMLGALQAAQATPPEPTFDKYEQF